MINHFTRTALLLIVLGSPMAVMADMADRFASLKGIWTCEEEGTRSTLDFQSANRLVYNGTATLYRASGNVLSVQEEYGITNYYYTLQGGMLTILSPDGSISNCKRGSKHVQQAQPLPAPGTDQQTRKYGVNTGWPPHYIRPSGRSSWDSSTVQHLLYKFAGRWDHYSGSTLINLYLKPNGTYKDSRESRYSGTFTDEDGVWDAVGTGQGQGRWTISGTLRQGTIILISPNDSQRTLNYRVHCRGNECYGSEYFFNGSLYSVKYIYR